MKKSEEQRTVEHYRQLLTEYGRSYRALNWGSLEGQRLRFQILAGIGDLNGKSVLDVGCGLGDFAGWLREAGTLVEYTGLDITPELVSTAKELHPGFSFLQGDILDRATLASRRFDYVFASGIFATYKEGGARWMESCLRQMWELAGEGIAFNALSSWSDGQEPAEYHADPLETLAFVSSLSRWVVLRHDYHPRDFTVYVLRSKRA